MTYLYIIAFYALASIFHALPVRAAHNVILRNHCPTPFHFWVVPPNTTVVDDDRFTVAAGAQFVHAMEKYPTGGVVLKISTRQTFAVAPQPVLQVEYNVAERLYYDLSAVDCDWYAGPENPMKCAFNKEGGVSLYTTAPQCAMVPCSEHCCPAAYHSEGGWPDEPSHSCELGVDVIFEACKSTIGTVQPPPCKSTSVKPPSSTSANLASITSANLPSSTSANLPSSTSAKPPSSTSANLPSSTSANLPSSTSAKPPSSTSAKPPSSTSANTPSIPSVNSPSSTSANPRSSTSADLPSSTCVKPPSSTSANAPSSTSVNAPSSTSANHSSITPVYPPSSTPVTTTTSCSSTTTTSYWTLVQTTMKTVTVCSTMPTGFIHPWHRWNNTNNSGWYAGPGRFHGTSARRTMSVWGAKRRSTNDTDSQNVTVHHAHHEQEKYGPSIDKVLKPKQGFWLTNIISKWWYVPRLEEVNSTVALAPNATYSRWFYIPDHDKGSIHRQSNKTSTNDTDPQNGTAQHDLPEEEYYGPPIDKVLKPNESFWLTKIISKWWYVPELGEVNNTVSQAPATTYSRWFYIPEHFNGSSHHPFESNKTSATVFDTLSLSRLFKSVAHKLQNINAKDNPKPRIVVPGDVDADVEGKLVFEGGEEGDDGGVVLDEW